MIITGKKHFILFMLLFVATVVSAGQTGTMIINGKETAFQIETQYRIGPGVVYTKYRFPKIEPYAYKMVVNVIEIDQTNPYVKQAPYLAEGKYFRYGTQVNEHKSRKKAGLKPLASVMGGAFTQVATGSVINPDWSVGGGLVIDGAICHLRNGVNYYIDKANKAHVGNVVTTVTAKSTSAGDIKVDKINRVRYNSSMVLFCNGFGKTRAATLNTGGHYETTNSEGMEAILRLKNTNVVGVGEIEAVVERTVQGSGYSFDDGYAVLSAKDGSALEYIKKLKTGETVTLSVSCKDAANASIELQQLATPLFGYGVKEGVAQTSKMAGYAQCATGVSMDGNTSYWVEMDNVQGVSDASVDVMNQFMQQIGIYNACLMDGGPSAEMQVAGEWVSVNSLGNGFQGRAIPSAIMVYSEAPDDNHLHEVMMVDDEAYVVMNVPYTPVFRAYNKYGDLLEVAQLSADSYHLEFEGNCGKVSADGKSFVADTSGDGYLTVCVNGNNNKASMHIIVSDISGVTVSPKTFYTSEGRGTQATLYLNYLDGSSLPLDSKDVEWTTDNRWAAVCTDGYIEPVQDGSADITASYNGMSDVCTVTVETELEEVVDLTSIITDVRDMNAILVGTPKSVEACVLPKSTGNAYLVYDDSEKEVTEIVGYVNNGQEATLVYKFDYDNPSIYPVRLKKLNLAGGYNFELKSLKVYYSDNTTAIETVSQELPAYVSRNADGSVCVSMKNVAENVRCSVYTLDGALVSEANGVGQTFVIPVTRGSADKVIVVCLVVDGMKYIYKIR